MKRLISLIIALTLGFPSTASAALITIQSGDTLGAIASKYGTTVTALAEMNGITNPNLIYAGDTLEVGDLGVAIPTVIALYTDSLATRMTETESASFTLVRGTDKQDRSLNGYYGFVIDEGSTSEEFILANCVATACTIVTRGIDIVDGSTSVSTLQHEHRRGATVKISNFPQLAVLSRILNGIESASSTFKFGSGETTDNKYLKADNGTTNLPFLSYNESLGRWQFSDDGVSTITMVTSSAGGLSASTTKAIGITDSKIHLNASSTQFGYDASGYLYAIPYFYNAATFKSTITVNGAMTVAAGSGTIYVPTPSDAGMAANKGYVDTNIEYGAVTGTTGIAVSAGDALYISSTSTLFKTSSSAASSTFQFVGIAIESASAAATVRYAPPGGKVCAYSGLSAGYSYYLNGTAGQLATTPGSFHAMVGRAVTANCILVTTPKFIRTGSQTASGVTSYFQETGFYPAHITIKAGSAGVGGQTGGLSIGDDTNTCIDYDGTAGSAAYNASKAWYTRNTAGTVNSGTVSSKSATGFILNTDTAGGSANVYWVAYSE